MTAFNTGTPAQTQSVAAFSQSIRDNLAALFQAIVTTGKAPGFDAAYTFTSGLLTSIVWSEQTGIATASTPARTSGQRIFIRATYTRPGGSVLLKIGYEYSSDSGSTYAALTDLAGNSFHYYNTSAGVLSTDTWATT